MSEKFQVNRRRVLVGGAVAAAGLALGGVSAGSASAAEPVEVLIVGSGYAGAVAALRLAQAGVSSLVLERGRRWPINPAGNTFATPQTPDGRAAWLSTTSPFTRATLDVYTGVLEAVPAGGITALAGAGVGGGSLVNNAVILAPSKAVFQKTFGNGFNHDEWVSSWFARARTLIGPAPIPDDVYASSFYTAARSFTDETARAGLNPFRVDMAVDWDVVRREIAGTVVPGVTVGQSIWGANSGAKRSVDRSILAQAEQTGKVTVQVLTRVVDITATGGRYLVACEQIDERGNVLSRPSFLVKHLFLAAGSINTSRLLVRAKARGGLPALNQHVGRYWGTNGDHRSVRYGMPDNNAGQGGPSGIVAQDLTSSARPVTILSFPWPLPVPQGTGALAGLAMSLVAPVGQFAYDAASDAVTLSWPGDSNALVKPTLDAITATVNRINAANPNTQTQYLDALTTSHSLGGAVLGLACTTNGQVRGYNNLYVVDSSLLPGSALSVPPALTVTALADYCMSTLVRRVTG